MKPRIVKKLSKKAHSIFAASPRRDFQRTAERVWIDDEFEPDWVSRQERLESSKKERLYRQARVRINHVPSIGGEYNSFMGDADDHCTLYEHAADYVMCASIDWDRYWSSYDPASDTHSDYLESNIKGRLTGKKVIERLREAAQELGA
ncbi:hypothetical protein VE30_02160 [Vreelandella aquamarina]|uniref:hypothetical protein n=1 Tax=Vreelandella aquamarina TaxID=77097 RepID=UPI0005CBA82F|nr:hypothetical protein [Halomonas meridiana]KJD20541.1 hypothetical protein VE30_02160 [Halomonas meridiana]